MSRKSLSEVNSTVSVTTGGKWRRVLAFFGPAYLVSVGYMDPGNWASDLAGGAQFGYTLIWVLLMSNLMALLLQSLAARMGIVTGLDLAQASREIYPRYVNLGLYVLAEIAIAACDLAEVIGMAIGLNLLFGLPLIWGVCLTVFDTFLLLFLLNKGMRKMEAFIICLVVIIGVSFVCEMLIVKPVIGEVVKGFVPSALSGSALYIAIAIIGATVMPHNLYLHSALVQTRKFGKDLKGLAKAIKYNTIDSAIALNLAFFVNAAILILAATAFYGMGEEVVKDIKIQDAHHLLQNLFGNAAPALFAIALIAAGQSSTVTGTLAGQIIMEGYLNLRLRPWLRRMLTRVIAIVPAVLVISIAGDDAVEDLLILSQVILSMQLGFAMIPLIQVVSDKARMGTFVIPLWVKILAWLSTVVIVGLNIKYLIEKMTELITKYPNSSWFILPAMLLLGSLLLYILLSPLWKRFASSRKVPHGEAKPLTNLSIPGYKHIAVTVDFSDMDRLTIEHALVQGGKQAQYLLIHVVETAGARILGKEIFDFETQKDTQNLQQYADDLLKLGYKCAFEVGYGSPTRIIPEIITTHKADFLVMGAHGHTGLKDVIFGETVDSVRHQVNVPVLIVKR